MNPGRPQFLRIERIGLQNLIQKPPQPLVLQLLDAPPLRGLQLRGKKASRCLLAHSVSTSHIPPLSPARGLPAATSDTPARKPKECIVLPLTCLPATETESGWERKSRSTGSDYTQQVRMRSSCRQGSEMDSGRIYDVVVAGGGNAALCAAL